MRILPTIGAFLLTPFIAVPAFALVTSGPVSQPVLRPTPATHGHLLYADADDYGPDYGSYRDQRADQYRDQRQQRRWNERANRFEARQQRRENHFERRMNRAHARYERRERREY